MRAALQYHAHQPHQPAAEFIYPSPYIPRHDALAAYARKAFPAKRPLLQACRALMERIHQDCRYESASADIHTPVLQALEQRKGVCQDFAHIRKLPSRWRRKTSSRLCWVEEVAAWSQFFGPRLFRSISSRGTKNPAQR